jgi:hypothetical protein
MRKEAWKKGLPMEELSSSNTSLLAELFLFSYYVLSQWKSIYRASPYFTQYITHLHCYLYIWKYTIKKNTTVPSPIPWIQIVVRAGFRTRIVIYAPMIYMAPCVMFLMRADPLRGQLGEGWAPKVTRLSARCHFTGPKKLSISRVQPPPTCPSNGSVRIKNHYLQGRINHWCIGGFICHHKWSCTHQKHYSRGRTKHRCINN